MTARALFWAALAVYEAAVIYRFTRAAIAEKRRRANYWRVKR